MTVCLVLHAYSDGIVNLSVFAEKDLHTSGQAAFNSQVMPSQML